jgi:hypothetical protein
VDILLSDDLKVNGKGDYVEVSGEENLRRSLLRRLLIRPGEYKLNPTYGVGLASFVKKPFTKANLDDLQHRIVDNISRDRRVDKVDSVKLDTVAQATSNGCVENVLRVTLVVIHKGRQLRFQPFSFSQSSVAAVGVVG